ncbi:MAG TPA: branched-chain alpha-keto acid dehydrogenase subunit E2 [Verrucomicrobiales bacterium]|nr:branched-chain alpha-keto acid dehydrogenase subunit E2 [Verrucomicrobiales bacterium]
MGIRLPAGRPPPDWRLEFMDVKLPKVGDAADSGTVATVLVQVGDTVAVDQTILELEQEKAVAPIRSPYAGKVTAVHVKEGDKISVGARLVSVDGGAGEAAPAAAPVKSPAKALAPRPPIEEDSESDLEEALPADSAEEGPEPAASPYVRKVARELGLKLSRVKGSARGGRVLMSDLARYIERLERGVSRAGRHADEPKGMVFAPVNQDFSLFGAVASEPLSPLRKIIAARMVENSASIPHVTQFDEADLSQIERLRAQYKGAYEKAGAKLTPTPFILKALVSTLKRHPKFNASVNEVAETLVLKHHYHLGIAVDTDAGLLVPVLRDADRKSLLEIAQELASIAEKARDRKLGPDEMKGGTFTISNQGAIGGGHFTPIINKPEVAILGIGKASLKPVVTPDGRIEARPMLPLTVSYDHRVIDGGAAARFMVDLIKALEAFPEDSVKL